MPDALILDAVRSPIGKRNGTLVLDPRRRARGSGSERAPCSARRRSGRGRGRPDGLRDPDRRAGLEHRPDGADGRRLAGDGGRHDRRPAVRLVDADELQRGDGDLVGSARPRRLGRRGDDVARADGVERRGPLGQAARALAARPAGDLGRGHRRRVEPVEGGARRVLVGIASAGDRGDRRGPFRERDRPGRGAEPTRRHAVCGRRDAPARDVRRGARRSQAVVPARRAR